MIITKAEQKNKNKIALESLSMDLKRVAIGYQRESLAMAERFYKEALLRKSEVDTSAVKPYIKTVLDKIESLQNQNHEELAENALVFSILIQNYSRSL